MGQHLDVIEAVHPREEIEVPVAAPVQGGELLRPVGRRDGAHATASVDERASMRASGRGGQPGT